MLGTPNQGSDCATVGLVMSLTLGLPNVIAPNQLRPGKVAEFNEVVTDERKVRFSILAGNNHRFLCNALEDAASDQFVTVPSAHYIYLDRGWTTSKHTEMTSSLGDFVQWVVPHLAQGRQASGLAGDVPETAHGALSAPPAQESSALQFSQIVSQTLSAGATVDIPIPVLQAQRLGVTLITGAEVTASLVNPNGVVVETSAANSDTARDLWRSLVVPEPDAGSWTLRLANHDSAAVPAMAAVILEGSPLRVVGNVSAPDAEGRVRLSVAVSDNGMAVTGATARVTLAHGSGTSQTIPLFDDGLHDDGAAGDGLFGAQTPALVDGFQGAIVSVEAAGESRIVPLDEGVDAIPPPAAQYRIMLPLVWR
jgi:hypothetical protein